MNQKKNPSTQKNKNSQRFNNEKSFFTEEEISQIKECLMKIFDSSNKIDIRTLKTSIVTLESRNPFLYSLLSDIANSSSDLNFESFIDELSKRLVNKDLMTRAGSDRIFEMYEDKNGILNEQSLIKVSKQLGETLTNEEITNIIENAASNKSDITRDEFYNILVRKTY
jgi:Ca2+-binding EF-hand superfamily protein